MSKDSKSIIESSPFDNNEMNAIINKVSKRTLQACQFYPGAMVVPFKVVEKSIKKAYEIGKNEVSCK